MLEGEKQPHNKILDFFMGTLGLMGLVVELVRMSDHRISWGHFAGGFVAATIAGILLIAVCTMALTAVDDEIKDLEQNLVPFGGIDSCYYDAMSNMSVVTSGNMRNMRTDYYQGDVCQ